jgi:hypothetical protein
LTDPDSVPLGFLVAGIVLLEGGLIVGCIIGVKWNKLRNTQQNAHVVIDPGPFYPPGFVSAGVPYPMTSNSNQINQQ